MWRSAFLYSYFLKASLLKLQLQRELIADTDHDHQCVFLTASIHGAQHVHCCIHLQRGHIPLKKYIICTDRLVFLKIILHFHRHTTIGKLHSPFMCIWSPITPMAACWFILLEAWWRDAFTIWLKKSSRAIMMGEILVINLNLWGIDNNMKNDPMMLEIENGGLKLCQS